MAYIKVRRLQLAVLKMVQKLTYLYTHVRMVPELAMHEVAILLGGGAINFRTAGALVARLDPVISC